MESGCKILVLIQLSNHHFVCSKQVVRVSWLLERHGFICRCFVRRLRSPANWAVHTRQKPIDTCAQVAKRHDFKGKVKPFALFTLKRGEGADHGCVIWILSAHFLNCLENFIAAAYVTLWSIIGTCYYGEMLLRLLWTRRTRLTTVFYSPVSND